MSKILCLEFLILLGFEILTLRFYGFLLCNKNKISQLVGFMGL